MIAEDNRSVDNLEDYYDEEYRSIYNEVYACENSLEETRKAKYGTAEERKRTIRENKIQIDKDLKRTFAKSKTFGENTEGQMQLRNVLEVLALKYTGIGYVQGMNYVVASILYH